MTIEENKQRGPKTYVDYEIFQGKVRLISDGNMQIIERDDAICMAKESGMSLVQIAYDKSTFPHAVCKIMDYGKFKYEQQKKEKAQKKAARAAIADVKEVIFGLTIDEGDKKTKTKHIRDFLSDGKTKVKVVVKLKRRELNLVEMAKNLMKDILDNFNDIATLDSAPSFTNGIISCVIRPNR